MASAPLYRLPGPPRLPRQARLLRSAQPLRLPVTLTATALALAVSSCASAPSGGPPRRATGTGSQVQTYVQPLPPPPPTAAKSWGPTEVVLGFLHASASYAFDPAAAGRYLSPELRKSWRPASGPVAVVGAPTGISAARYYPSHLVGAPAPGTESETVKFTGQRLATLSQTGQYQYTPGQNVQYQFILTKTNGVWLIDELPQPGLVLTQSDFESVYQARNLFFYAPPKVSHGSVGILVPDPVYAPLQSSNSALNTNLATGLVKGLLQGPGHEWLSGATSSAFPAGSALIKQVTITGRVAQVDIGGAAVHASAQQIQLMEAQLTATLGDRSYSAPLASQVQLYINNTLQYAWSTSIASMVPPPSSGPILAITGPSTVGQLPGHPRAVTKPMTPFRRVSPQQIGGAAITAIAAEPTDSHTPQIAVAVAAGTGCAVFMPTGGGTLYHSYVLTTSGGPCTSLSWDSNGNLWAAAGQAVWVLQAQNRHPVLVDLGDLTAIGQSGSSILSLRMAPDNVRAALLVHTRSANKLLLAAVRFDHGHVAFGKPVSIGAGGAEPLAISWSDPYHLAVLAGQQGQAGSVIFAMPLTGGAGLQPGSSPQLLGAAPTGAQTLTTDGSELVVGTTDGHINRIYASSPASPAWSQVTTGADPVYPG